MIAVAELELYDVADGGDDGIRDKCVLGSADDHGDDLISAAVRLHRGQGGGRSGDGEDDTDGSHGGGIGVNGLVGILWGCD